MLNIKVILSTIRLQSKKTFARSMYRFCLFANPLANTILLYEMFINSGQDNFGTYIVLGAGLMGLWSCICFSSAGDINRERWEGTLSMLFISPSSFGIIIMSKIIGNTVLSLVTWIITLISAKMFFNIEIKIYHPAYFLIAFLATILSFIVISMIIAYLLTLSRKTTLYMNCIEIPIMLICGFIFPIEILPKWASTIGCMFPQTWAIKLLRRSIEIEIDKKLFLYELFEMILWTILYVGLINITGKIIEKRVRISASLELS